MLNDTQYGRTLFIEDFKAGAAKQMNRIHFSKSASGTNIYDEAWVQRLIMDQPSLLPIDQIEPAFAGLVPICIELPTPSGFVDNLLVTPTGNVALVECKLWRNPEARREVVGQIIDYAKDLSVWTYEQLQEAISRTKALEGSNRERQRSLYEAASANEEMDEASFHDAVSRNLRRGRFLLLIVGDGIREGVESMTEFLQQHAGLHFTLALVDLALFEVPTGGYLAQPRVLARTTNIDRGIVTIDNEGRITIKPTSVAPIPAGSPGGKMTITKELYLEKLEKELFGISERLNRFTDKLAICGVSSEFGGDSMIFRWHPDGTRPWNLGTIASSAGHVGELWMDYMGKRAESEGLLDPFKQCLASLAGLVPGARIKQTKKESAYNVAAQDGRIIRVDALLADESREDGWLHAIEQFQAVVTKTLPGN